MANTKIPVELSSTPGIVDNSNATAITIDSSENVGIGTTDPTVASGNGLAIYDSVVPRVQLRNSTSGDTSGDGVGIFMSGSDLGIENRESSNIIFYNNNEKMRIDSSGNLLVGKTNTTLGTVGIENRADGRITSTRSGNTNLVLNRLTSDGSLIDFYKDGSTVGSIGASSGDVYIGTGDTGLKFNDSLNQIYAWDTSTNSVRDNLTDLGASTARFKDLYLSGTLTNDGTGGISVDTAGLVGIGTSSPAYNLQVVGSVGLNTSGSGLLATFGASNTSDKYVRISGSSGNFEIGSHATGSHYLYGTGSIPLTFFTNGSERMRIDASGNLNLNTTGQTDGKFCVNNASGQYGIKVNDFVSNGALIKFTRAATQVGSISTNGTTTTYNTSSDARLKDVTGEARGLEVINELNPVSYNWKVDGKADEGLIAQEVLDIVPNAVSGSEEDMYQMDYSKLVVHLVAGMKEQQTQIEALQSEINELKNS